MAPAAPVTIRYGVTLWYPSGIGLGGMLAPERLRYFLGANSRLGLERIAGRFNSIDDTGRGEGAKQARGSPSTESVTGGDHISDYLITLELVGQVSSVVEIERGPNENLPPDVELHPGRKMQLQMICV